MSYRILVVDPTPVVPPHTEQAFENAGYRVAAVRSFQEATRMISRDCPDLIVTTIRLEAFNGLHVLLRVRADHAELPVILVGDPADFTTDIDRYGAQFVGIPIDLTHLLRTVSTLLAGRTPRDPRGERRWPRRSVALTASVHESAARVVELSYGGLRLEMDASPEATDKPIEISFPALGLSVIVMLRWAKPVGGAEFWWCGLELAPAPAETIQMWRSLVDSVN
jgi:DNA-binding response OmpR family regulator